MAMIGTHQSFLALKCCPKPDNGKPNTKKIDDPHDKNLSDSHRWPKLMNVSVQYL
jgi:hypothetical protein